jgi:hypothetical protein
MQQPSAGSPILINSVFAYVRYRTVCQFATLVESATDGMAFKD